MGVIGFDDLRSHIGHDVVVVCYTAPDETEPANVAVECDDCGEVLFDFDNPEPRLTVLAPHPVAFGGTPKSALIDP